MSRLRQRTCRPRPCRTMWLRRKLRQVREGALGRHGMYLPTVAWLTSMPSLSSSPWMRGAPHSGLAKLSWRIRSRISGLVLGRPRWRDPDRQRQIEPEALAIPLDHGCGLHQHHGVQDPRADPVQPNPKQPICGEGDLCAAAAGRSPDAEGRRAQVPGRHDVEHGRRAGKPGPKES